MSECECCGYAGQDLPKYRELLRLGADAHIQNQQARIEELEAELERMHSLFNATARLRDEYRDALGAARAKAAKLEASDE